MTGPGRRILYKPEHPGRARELCVRGATNPEITDDQAATLDAAGERDRHAANGAGVPPLGETAKMSGGNAGNAGNLQSLGNSGLFGPAAKRRKLAEIGGNSLQRLCPGNRSWFGCLIQGVHARRFSGRTYAHR
jgi:hypothetical protein